MGGCLGGLQTALAGVSLNVQAAFKSSKRLKSSLHFFNCGGAALSGSLIGAMGCLKNRITESYTGLYLPSFFK